MNQILIIAGVIGLLLFLRWIRKQPRNKQIQGVLIFAAIVLLGLALTGKSHWLFAVGAAAAAAFQKLIALLRYAPLFKNIFSNLANNNSDTGDKDYSVNARTNTKISKEEAYKILGLNEGATKEEIIEAHRKLIQRNHPDRGGNDYLASQINQAKDYLLDKIV